MPPMAAAQLWVQTVGMGSHWQGRLLLHAWRMEAGQLISPHVVSYDYKCQCFLTQTLFDSIRMIISFSSLLFPNTMLSGM